MDWEKLFFSKLIIAVPEIAWNDEMISFAVRRGFITEAQLDSLRYWKGQVNRTGRIARRLSSKSFTQRLLILAPELISIQSINLLRRLNVIDDTAGHQLRLFIRALTVSGVVPGAIPSNTTLRARLQSLIGVGLSQETIDLLRLVPVPGLGRELSVEEAQFLRGTLIGAARLNAAREVLTGGGGLVDRLILVAGELLTEEVVRAGVLTGAISQKNARLMIATIKIGSTAWRTSTRAWNAEGFEQRALIAAQGILSSDMVNFLRATKIIDARTARTLQVVTQMARSLARTRLDSITQIARNYRVIPGEAPITTFARVSRVSDRDILDLLNEAAETTSKRIKELAPKEKLGAKARAAQERILLNSLYGEMRSLWEGVGYLTIIGEQNAARAAVDSMDYLTRAVYGRSGHEADLLRRQLREAGRAGVDSLISREENLRALSSRVYKNIALSQNQIGRRIQVNLIRGVSAKEFAADIASLIRPNVKGGVSYSAMRLARTEINNAFHGTAIRYTREMPWVNGYKWNLSGTHRNRVKGSDVCDDYATEDGYNLGPGNYPKRAVPSKPHPLCLCFVTVIVDDARAFANKYRSGAYNNYINTRRKAGLFDETPDPIAEASWKNAALKKGALALGGLAGGAAFTFGTRALKHSLTRQRQGDSGLHHGASVAHAEPLVPGPRSPFNPASYFRAKNITEADEFGSSALDARDLSEQELGEAASAKATYSTVGYFGMNRTRAMAANGRSYDDITDEVMGEPGWYANNWAGKSYWERQTMMEESIAALIERDADGTGSSLDYNSRLRHSTISALGIFENDLVESGFGGDDDTPPPTLAALHRAMDNSLGTVNKAFEAYRVSGTQWMGMDPTKVVSGNKFSASMFSSTAIVDELYKSGAWEGNARYRVLVDEGVLGSFINAEGTDLAEMALGPDTMYQVISMAASEGIEGINWDVVLRAYRP